jgi:hypothetical protein
VNPDCYLEAAQSVLERLCEATGRKAGVNAFLFYLPPVHSAFAVSLSGGGQAAELAQCPVTHLRMAAEVVGRFTTPQEAMRFVVQVLAVLPADNVGRLQRLHLVEAPTVEVEFTQLANQSEPGMFYLGGLKLEVVFATA